MLTKLLSILSMKTPDTLPELPTPPTGLHHPYRTAHLDLLYNLLFCDDADLLAQHIDGSVSGPWQLLGAADPGEAALRSIADDERLEGRARAFAFNRLRATRKPVPPAKLLGVIVEVQLADGLDVLAAFSDGGVRYLNHAGKALVIEGDAHPAAADAKALLAACEPVVAQIGRWEKARLAPPPAGHVRLTFLVSDGLYFGQGPHAALAVDALAGTVLARATELLTKMVETGLAAGAGTGPAGQA